MKRLRIVAQMKRLWPLLVAVAILAGGCWDYMEINRRSFVIGVGIDLPQHDDLGKEPAADARNRPARFRMSTEVVLWQGGSQTGSGGGAFLPELTKPARVVTGTGRTLFDIEAILNTRVTRELYWSHLKTIFIGEDFAREVGLKPIIDFFTRDQEFNRRMHIGVTQGEALAFIESTALGDEFMGEHVAAMFEHTRFPVRAPDGNVNDVDAAMRDRGNILLPRFTLGDQEVKVAGAAIIKHGKMVDWLGESQAVWALFVLGKEPGGTILIADPADAAGEVLFGLNGSHTRLTLDNNKDNLSFSLTVQTEGVILERTMFDASVLDTEWIASVEKAVADTIKAGMRDVVQLLQHTYRVDVFGFDDYLRKRRPEQWKQLEDSWDDRGFGDVEINIDATVKVRHHGTTR